MSRWSEFGFPITGPVPFHLALEGLFRAIMERGYAYTGDNKQSVYDNFFLEPRKYKAVIDEIDYLIDGLGIFQTPDGLYRVSLLSLADYLGENLIPSPSSSTAISGPDWHGWAMQRYRMLNVLYRAYLPSPLSWNFRFYTGSSNYNSNISIQDSWIECDKRFEAPLYRPGLPYDDGHRQFPSSGEQAFLYCEESRSDFFTMRVFTWLKDAEYPLYSPADIVLIFELKKVYHSGYYRELRFNSFDTGLKEGENTCTIPANFRIRHGDLVDIPPYMKQKFEMFHPVSPPAPDPFVRFWYGDGCERRFLDGCYADFRPSLEFYDPIEGGQ